jgi:tRNA (guanine37-N1)-methyltransferase
MLREYDILTLFPEMAEGFLFSSIMGRAQASELIAVRCHQLRDWASGPHKKTDAIPYGGGAGMVLKPEPIFEAYDSLKRPNTQFVYMAPDGQPLSTPLAKKLAESEHLMILSGHYEGVDQRVRDELVDLEVSIGDYVLTNGTLAAAVLVDCVSRFIPGVLGDEKSLTDESFTDNLLSFPQYTRPASYRSLSVPEVLLSGDHGAIASWRREHQYAKTQSIRPDLLI